ALVMVETPQPDPGPPQSLQTPRPQPATVIAVLGPLNCGPLLNLSEAIFSVPVTIQVAAEEVRCVRTRWDATVSLRLRYAKVDLSDAVVTQPTAVTTHPTPFPNMPASDFTGEPTVKMTSLRGIDTAHLVLTDTDLSSCVFTGAFHLDQLRLAGRTQFASVPTGIIRHGLLPMRFTRRRTLVEEHHWRAIRTPTTNWVPRAILQHSPPNPMTWLPEALLPRRTTSRTSSVSTITLLAAGDTVALHPQAA
ncbi:hypothetical protein ACFW5D_32805, partial [Streptomyces sp. NPDC058770]